MQLERYFIGPVYNPILPPPPPYAEFVKKSSRLSLAVPPAVLADLLGADMFTNSFGLLLLFQGVATFIGPPVVGGWLTLC